MNHYIIKFLAVINGNESIKGNVGSTSRTTDYKPNIIKDSIIAKYKKQYGNVPIAVTIIDKPQLVTSEQYKEAAKTFINLD
jgi:hypothetical protein